MARRKEFSPTLAVLVFLIFVASAVWKWIGEASIATSVWLESNKPIAIAGSITFVVILIFIFLLVRIVRVGKLRRRIAFLMQKYNDDTVVQGILKRQYWIDATDSMLVDSLGVPEDKDHEVMKRKTKETWKYGKKQANQYRLRIYLENGCVIGWDQKS